MNDFPPVFRHIRLVLAREAGHPGGDADHGYDILAPLTEDGHLDSEAWRAHRSRCRVRRFRPDEKDAIGKLMHGPGGRWFIEYEDADAGGNERGFQFEQERFVPGEYVSLVEPDGEQHTYIVKQVGPLD